MKDYLSLFNQKEKEEYVNNLIEIWKQNNKYLQDKAEKLPENIPEIKELKEGNYALVYNSDIWDIEIALKFYNKVLEMCPNSSFVIMPDMDLVEISEEELKIINNIKNRASNRINGVKLNV